ncbi:MULTISPECIES: Bax inhibitor-1 family protein [unclassified Synechococcus]|uniref:Bax inhibitor-1/YccA family protein n=1 Tax=unclassified Synechococcus TaxID=2626047 RepID=UPI000B98F6DE|nr:MULTISPECIES: Bax inhibitor-1 family protein [unclassified Synechococcus]MBD2719064.1 US12 family protein [Synechococcus sp. FACHB-909]
MPARSNFQEAIREAQSSALVGPNVVNKALPYVGGGMVLTAAGVAGGLATLASLGPVGFQGISFVAIIPWFILFFVAQNAANRGNNGTALPLLVTFSLLTGFTLTSLVVRAVAVAGAGAIGTAALATGITFVIASFVGRRMSDSIGQALSGVVSLGLVGLLIAMVVQIVGSIFAPGMFGGNALSLMIAGFGTVVFVGLAFVDFYTMPRTYSDDQYLVGALGMYLTYINLFAFILQLIIALQGGGRRD